MCLNPRPWRTGFMNLSGNLNSTENPNFWNAMNLWRTKFWTRHHDPLDPCYRELESLTILNICCGKSLDPCHRDHGDHDIIVRDETLQWWYGEDRRKLTKVFDHCHCNQEDHNEHHDTRSRWPCYVSYGECKELWQGDCDGHYFGTSTM